MASTPHLDLVMFDFLMSQIVHVQAGGGDAEISSNALISYAWAFLFLITISKMRTEYEVVPLKYDLAGLRRYGIVL